MLLSAFLPSRPRNFLATAALAAASVGLAHGAFLIEIDTDGLDDGILTFSPNFSFGGDTTTASQSVAGSAVGLTGGDSVFGGDGATEDTYLYSYTPVTDVDNLSLAAGTDLNGTDSATGIAGDVSGLYRVYATWPNTSNVSGGDVTYTLSGPGGDLLTAVVNQNDTNDPNFGDLWFPVGEASLTAGTTYTLSQTSGSATFVSMRGAAAMFERVPEPSTGLLAASALGALALRRRRRG